MPIAHFNKLFEKTLVKGKDGGKGKFQSWSEDTKCFALNIEFLSNYSALCACKPLHSGNLNYGWLFELHKKWRAAIELGAAKDLPQSSMKAWAQLAQTSTKWVSGIEIQAICSQAAAQVCVWKKEIVQSIWSVVTLSLSTLVYHSPGSINIDLSDIF